MYSVRKTLLIMFNKIWILDQDSLKLLSYFVLEDTNQNRRAAALLGLPQFLSEDSSDIIRMCDVSQYINTLHYTHFSLALFETLPLPKKCSFSQKLCKNSYCGLSYTILQHASSHTHMDTQHPALGQNTKPCCLYCPLNVIFLQHCKA